MKNKHSKKLNYQNLITRPFYNNIQKSISVYTILKNKRIKINNLRLFFIQYLLVYQHLNTFVLLYEINKI